MPVMVYFNRLNDSFAIACTLELMFVPKIPGVQIPQLQETPTPTAQLCMIDCRYRTTTRSSLVVAGPKP